MSSTSSSQQSNKTLLGQKYMIGEELGRGAYGQVFKGMDTSTGDVVAIKQIGLGGVSQANLQGVMGEIDLLKTLNHNNIVKYIGSFKSRNHLYIILEFMENGALSSVIKPTRFGVFPETLVAIYIAQVLQGLAYLHDQGVVHRDIKGANILTTKDVSHSASAAAALGVIAGGRGLHIPLRQLTAACMVVPCLGMSSTATTREVPYSIHTTTSYMYASAEQLPSLPALTLQAAVMLHAVGVVLICSAGSGEAGRLWRCS